MWKIERPDGDRRRFAWIVGLIAVLMPVFARCADAQQDFSGVEVTATHVAGNVYMLEGRGGNIGVSIGEDGALLVDDQFAPLADKIRASLADLIDGEVEIAFILNTHWHPDHTDGNVEFGPEAPIVAHANVRKRLSTRQETAFGVAEPSPDAALPVVTFGDSVSIHFNGEEIRVIHFPHGHTDGDAVIFFTGSNVVHMGDNYFAARFPFVDLGSGGNVQGVIRAVAGVIEQVPSDVHIIPGHGPLSTVDDLREYLEMMEESVAMVSAGIEAGLGLEDLQDQGMPERWTDWSWRFIDEPRWIEMVYGSLQGS